MAVLWSCLCSTEEAISYWLPCLVNQFEIEYEARKKLFGEKKILVALLKNAQAQVSNVRRNTCTNFDNGFGHDNRYSCMIIMILMITMMTNREHYDSYHPPLWDAGPRNLSFNFGAKITCAYFASGQSMTIRHWVIFHHLATFGGRQVDGERRLIFFRSKKTLIFTFVISELL